MRFICFAVTLVSVLSFSNVKAQNFTLGVGPEFSFPSGNSTNVSSIGVGGTLKAEIGLSDQFAITAQGSILSFFGKRFFGTTMPTNHYVPIKGGFKYYLSEGFYAEGQLGTALPLNELNNTSLVWSPGIGTHINTRNSNNKLDVGFRYEGWSSVRTTTSSTVRNTTFSFIALRVGYSFGL